MAINKRDYYEVLGVARTATEQDLKSAYRRLAHQYHPDKNQGDAGSEEKFKEAAEAYAVLSDAEQRQRYDRFGHAGVASAAGAAWGAPGFGNIEDILGDLFGFGDVFAGGRTGSRRSSAQRGADLRYDLEITLEQAAAGLTAQLRIPKQETCESCKGSGAKEGTQIPQKLSNRLPFLVRIHHAQEELALVDLFWNAFGPRCLVIQLLRLHLVLHAI